MNGRNPTFQLQSNQLQLILLALLAGIVLIMSIPIGEIPGRDSGVFLYIGEQILDGKIPYRDMWDHKGPLLYYINALGLLIGQGQVWGLWILEYFSLGTAVYFSYKLLNQAFGRVAAFVGVVSWLLNATLLQIGGNMTEAYTLPLQFLSLYLFWRSTHSKQPTRYFFGIGIAFAAAFLLRPNNVGTHLSIMLYIAGTALISRHWRPFLQKLAVFLGGAALPMGLAFIYFASNHALVDLIDQLFLFNLTYAAASYENRLISGLIGLFAFMSFGLVVVVFTAWILGWLQAFRKDGVPANLRPLIQLSLIMLPVEAFLASYSGAYFAHYFIALLPIFGILSSYFIFGILTNLDRFSPWVSCGVLLIVFIFANNRPINKLIWEYSHLSSLIQHDAYPGLVEIEKTAQSHEYLLMWGAETTVNFLLEKESPSRFVYQYPLLTAGYASPEMVAEFLVDIQEKRPLLIDTSATNSNVPPLDVVKRNEWAANPGSKSIAQFDANLALLQPLFEYIQVNYVIVNKIGPDAWPVYVYAGP